MPIVQTEEVMPFVMFPPTENVSIVMSQAIFVSRDVMLTLTALETTQCAIPATSAAAQTVEIVLVGVKSVI